MTRLSGQGCQIGTTEALCILRKDAQVLSRGSVDCLGLTMSKTPWLRRGQACDFKSFLGELAGW